MAVAIIPARGGSKRIPGKNIREFCGKPIIAYSIEAALNSGVVNRVIVSTDDDAIAAVAREYGAETPFVRPPYLSDDMTPTVPVIKHAVEWLESNSGPVSEVCCIYATAPFVTAEDLRGSHARLVGDAITGYVFSATSFGFPIQRAFRIDKQGFCEMFHPELYNARSQDLEEAFQDAGQFYWGSAAAYLGDKIFFSRDSKPYVLPRYRAQDIDTVEDWHRAELMFKVIAEAPQVRSPDAGETR